MVAISMTDLRREIEVAGYATLTEREMQLLAASQSIVRQYEQVKTRAEEAEKAEGELSTLVLKLQHIMQELPAKATAKDLRATMKLVKEELAKVEGMDGDGN